MPVCAIFKEDMHPVSKMLDSRFDIKRLHVKPWQDSLMTMGVRANGALNAGADIKQLNSEDTAKRTGVVCLRL